MGSTLLITTALAPEGDIPYLHLGAGARRTLATKAAAMFWATAPGIERMVIADATGCELLSAADVALVEANGVEVEQVSYEQDGNVATLRGKGAAEGALIAHALEASRLLRAQECFFKVTGKLLCRNFGVIRGLVESHGLTRLFWRDCRELPEPSLTELRFFYAGRDFYLEHLAAGYAAADDRAGRIAEATCAPVVSARCSSARMPRPLLFGLSGGSAAAYGEWSLGRLDESFPCWYSAD